MIQVHGVSKIYGEVRALDNIDFEIRKGTICGLLGPNGAGKSTLMNIMTGYLSATEGSVEIAGIRLEKEPEKAKRHIGYLPEIPPVYMDMTPREYLEFAASIKGLPRGKCKSEAERTMKATAVTEMKNRLIRNLSKGYRQRVGLACALLGDPEIIILDEPTVGMDPKQLAEVRRLIQSLRDEHTVIVSSHILSEIAEICDEVLIMAKGKLIACDTPDNLRRKMQGVRHVRISVESTEEELRKVLDGMPFECTYRIKSEAEGICTAMIETDSHHDRRKDIMRRLVESNVTLLELAVQTQSLEAVYMELTNIGD